MSGTKLGTDTPDQIIIQNYFVDKFLYNKNTDFKFDMY